MRFAILLIAMSPLCFTGCSKPASKLRPGITFEVHSVASQQGANTKALTDPDSGNVLHVVNPALVTAANVETAAVIAEENGRVMFDVKVDALGAAQLQAATVTPGNQVAVVVNGKIAAAPTVRSPVSNQFRITGSYSRSEWEKLLQ